MAQPNPYLLACDNPAALLELLRANPSIASCQDESGYSLLHASSSYGHVDLLRALVKEFHVDVNLLDEDGETCLFVTESPEIARCLIEELKVDYNKKNSEGYTAVEKMEADEEFPQVTAYLREVVGGAPAETDSGMLNPRRAFLIAICKSISRRIEELATREDYWSEEVQNEVRELVKDAMAGSNIEAMERELRRRTE
ncbi:uncharacterized protein N7446_011510 [Penicillium canescens]|uniref:uncharacterized protein n=1 Tax=Penicillium canescens TaxID=5083 RepID=UPI0026E09F59|nr:uncharacterized protein N7446_011510 [Penicillium canescens]KAJ6048827.1 hypothetical protein N7446_011510 [Penicillium canescens]